MKRYKLDLSAEEFFAMVRNQQITESTNFEVYDAPDPVALKMSVKPKPAVARKPRRTKVQIEADKMLAAAQLNDRLKNGPTDANQRAFPWKDPEMNVPLDERPMVKALGD